jgi:hypothetical protein
VYLLIDAPDVGPEINFLVMTSRDGIHTYLFCFTYYILVQQSIPRTVEIRKYNIRRFNIYH